VPGPNKLTPMPASGTELPYSAEFSSSEFEQIGLGLRPKTMDDKWYTFLTHKTLSIHRSWTGICIYQVEFKERIGGWVVCRTLVNRDSGASPIHDDVTHCELIHFIIYKLMLGQEIAIPGSSD